MTRKEFIDTYTNKYNSLIIGIETPQQLKYLLYLLEKLKIDLPTAYMTDNLKYGLAMNRKVGLLLKISYNGTPQWSYTTNADEIRDYTVKWFKAVKTDVLEGDKL